MIKMHHDYLEELQELKRLARLHNYPCTDKLVKEFSREQLVEFLIKNKWGQATSTAEGTVIYKDIKETQRLLFIPYTEDKEKYFTRVSKLIDTLAKELNISVIELVYYIKQVKIAYAG